MNKKQQIKQLKKQLTDALNANVDKTINNASGTYRKPRSIFGYENLFLNDYYEPTYGSSFYSSLVNGFSALFEWKNLPEEITSSDLERFLVSSGRIKIIKVGTKFYAVHITPQKWDLYGNIVKSWIVEPYLPQLNGKETEKFKNVELKNNNLGMSIIRLIFPYLNGMDNSYFDLENHSKLLAGKLVYVSEDESQNEDARKKIEDSINQWAINGKPVKVIKAKLLESGANPLQALEITDSIESFIKVVKFNINQILNTLGLPNDNSEEKKERKIVSEIAIQNILQSTILIDMEEFRLKSAKLLNKEFGWNLTVGIKENLKEEMADRQELKNGDGDQDV